MTYSDEYTKMMQELIDKDPKFELIKKHGINVGLVVSGESKKRSGAPILGMCTIIKGERNQFFIPFPQLRGLAAGVGSTVTNYKAENAKADATELQKIMQELQRRLDESEEELNAILQAIQDATGQIADILASETDTQSEIAGKIGQMA